MAKSLKKRYVHKSHKRKNKTLKRIKENLLVLKSLKSLK